MKARRRKERRIDIARAYGYEDGSAITQRLKRLENEDRSKPALAGRMARVEGEGDDILSRVDPVPHRRGHEENPAADGPCIGAGFNRVRPFRA